MSMATANYASVRPAHPSTNQVDPAFTILARLPAIAAIVMLLAEVFPIIPMLLAAEHPKVVVYVPLSADISIHAPGLLVTGDGSVRVVFATNPLTTIMPEK